jgi:hypothetical protein
VPEFLKIDFYFFYLWWECSNLPNKMLESKWNGCFFLLATEVHFPYRLQSTKYDPYHLSYRVSSYIS